ncbi:hypothetical protein NC651_040022 [Populus alba x Populus x berolinensis]|nr:hypothetical protein NC651_040022 [Populus alba x Populus x berolinensis]
MTVQGSMAWISRVLISPRVHALLQKLRDFGYQRFRHAHQGRGSKG